MVIWGAYDDFGVTPRIELLRQPLLDVETSLPQRVLDAVGPATAEAADKAGPSRLGDASYLTCALLASTDLDLFVVHGPQQMATMVSAILATGLYADGQYQDVWRSSTRRWPTSRPAAAAQTAWRRSISSARW